MELIGRLFGGLFHGLLAIFGGMSAGASLTAISLLLGVAMLFVFKWVGDPAVFERTKNRIQAHLMEMRLFDTEPKVVLRALGRLLAWNGRFMLVTLKPALIATVPMVLLFVQMEHYYGRRALRSGEATVVTATLADFAADSQTVRLEGDQSVTVETLPVRVAETGQVSWSVRAREQGDAHVRLRVGAELVSKSVSVAQYPHEVSPRRVASGFDQLWFPNEPPILAAAVTSIDVAYPSVATSLLGIELHWLIWLVLISVLGAFVVRAAVNSRRPGTF